jgi:hypothetical protein
MITSRPSRSPEMAGMEYFRMLETRNQFIGFHGFLWLAVGFLLLAAAFGSAGYIVVHVVTAFVRYEFRHVVQTSMTTTAKFHTRMKRLRPSRHLPSEDASECRCQPQPVILRSSFPAFPGQRWSCHITPSILTGISW